MHADETLFDGFLPIANQLGYERRQLVFGNYNCRFFVFLQKKMIRNIKFLWLLLLASCGSAPLTINRDTLRLKGPVESITDKQIRSVYDKDWNTVPDTSGNGLPAAVTTRFFDEEGVWVRSVTEMPEGTLYSTTTVQFAENGDYAGSEDIGPDNKPMLINKVTKITPDVIEFESFDRFNKKLSTSVSEYKDGLLVKQSTRWTEGGIFFETVFERNDDGEETGMIFRNNMSVNEFEDKSSVKLLDFDDHGNWTRQILYHPGQDNKCVLIERKITYYED